MNGNIVKAKNKLKIVEKMNFEKEWKDYFKATVFYSILLLLIVAINNNKKELYKKYRDEIKNSQYKQNEYVKKLLIERQGKLKTFVLMTFVINSYYLSMPIVKIFLKRR